MQAIVLAGGAVGIKQLRKELKECRHEQKVLSQGLEQSTKRMRSPKVAVDALFFARLKKILAICVPSFFSYEAGLIYFQTILLVGRSLLTDYVSRLEGKAGRWIIAQDWDRLWRVIGLFCAISFPAAVINSGLKYLQKRIKLAFMRRLTHRLHELYCDHRAYYAASTLGGLTNADQRITEDVEKFSFAVSDLYAYTFKPLLDVLLFTKSLSKTMGYKGQFAIYGYYFVCAMGLRAVSPPLAAMTAQETALAGAFRSAHQRLVVNSEEVAFNDPPAGAAEQMILNQHLWRLLRHGRLSAFQQFVQQVLDGYFIKYGATVVALSVYATMMYSKTSYGPPGSSGKAGGRAAGSEGQLTQDYISAMRLLGNTSKAIGDLVLVYKRVTGVAGHTSRVAELLEQMKTLAGGEEIQTQLYLRNVSSSGSLLPTSTDGSFLPLPEPTRVEGETVKFDRLYLSAPDGTTLVKELSFEVLPGHSVLIMGPNGSGKSSLFRVAAGLWPLQAGTVQLPGKRDIFYLSQRAYLVSGTLRDQLLYPEPPRAVWDMASDKTQAKLQPWLKSTQYTEDELEDRLSECLEAVELDYLLGRGRGWNQTQAWNETLSGGEKQRLACARLLFHAPKYAVLDECTSAVSADGEKLLYEAIVRAGVTMLSIGHRPAIKQYHSTIVHFEGVGSGKGWSVEKLRDADAEGLIVGK